MREIPLTSFLFMIAISVVISMFSAPLSQPAFAGTAPEPSLIIATIKKSAVDHTSSSPRFARPHETLTSLDEIATLEAVHLALSGTADGESYVWRSAHGRLNAILQPTSSFLDKHQRVCRHVIIMLVSGTKSQRAEGIACRTASGTWSLAG